MEIREATEADIPEIVSLLKLSLGESLMPKSEQYWRWKHLENPFGPSPVLLCWEGSQLVGVRAFMRWEWIQQGQVYRAVRAVDTATHPAHQGKGIFKKLTLALVESCSKQGAHFVFNTPNQQSRPGYLKMGWEEAGKLQVGIRLEKPFSVLVNMISQRTKSAEHGHDDINRYLQHADLESLLAEHHHRKQKINTNSSVAYLNWRYRDVPVAHYVAIGTEFEGTITGLVVGRIKKTRMGRELRITDYFSREKSNEKDLMKKLETKMKEWSIDYATISTSISDSARRVFRRFYLSAPFGPIVTVRTLALPDLTILKNFNEWSPSLGDLELF